MNFNRCILFSKLNFCPGLMVQRLSSGSNIVPLKIAHKKLKIRSKEQDFKDFHPTYQNFKELEAELEGLNQPTISQLEINYNIRDLEVKQIEKLRRFKIIESKYFRPEPEVCLITWSMKLQIRELHALDPDTWSPWAISQTFPISLEGVKKLLRNRPKNASQERIRQHDLRVIENWKRKTDGSIGNLSLLKKVIKERVSNTVKSLAVRANEAAPDPSFLKGLKFMDDGEMNAQNLREVQTSRKKTKKLSFKFIIENYEDQKRDLDLVEKQKGNKVMGAVQSEAIVSFPVTTKEKVPDLSTKRSPVLSSTDVKVVHNSKPRRHSKRVVTFEEFKKLKNMI